MASELITPEQFWKLNGENYADEFNCMNSWTLGQFLKAMEFANQYRKYCDEVRKNGGGAR